jgi:hypothetical protein
MPPTRRRVESLNFLEMAQERLVKAALDNDLQRVGVRFVDLDITLHCAVKLDCLV